MKNRPILICFILLLLASVVIAQADDAVTAIKAGQIITVSGDPVSNGIIIIKDGKIVEVGTDITIPEGANIIDASKKVVMPGLINAVSVGPVRGDRNEQSSEVTPTFRISQAIDPSSKYIKHMPQMGTTSFYVSPGIMNLIGGLGVVVKPVGKTTAEMIVKDDVGLWVMMGSSSTFGNIPPRGSAPRNFFYRRPTTRMSVGWMLRDSFSKAQKYAQLKEKDKDPELEIIASTIKGEIPVHIGVMRITDLRMAMNLAKDYGFNATLFGCTEAHRIAQEIASNKMSVVLTPHSNSAQVSPYAEGQDIKWNNAKILTDAGVKVALADSSSKSDLFSVALFAVRHGMTTDEALRAVTLSPAEILGVADRLGSIEKGKDADLLILSAKPLSGTTRIEKVIINGKTVHKAD